MISVIVCSRSSNLYEALSANIAETIGVPFQLVKVENNLDHPGICKAYNEGAQRSEYEYLVFVHEDVLFRTQQWGQRLLEHFQADPSIGLIGLAGAVYKTKMASGWWQSETGWQEPRRMNIIQHNKNPLNPQRHILINPNNELRTRVVSIDGVFMATKKQVWKSKPFDDVLLKNFHGYDFDFSMQVGQQLKNVVVYDILLDHFSGGTYDLNWLAGMMTVHKKWKHALPIIHEQCAPHGSAVYNDGWKRIRKHTNLAIEQGATLAQVIKQYNFLVSCLDNRPSSVQFFGDYVKGLSSISRLFINSKKKANTTVVIAA